MSNLNEANLKIDENDKKIKILHLAFGGIAGSPRGTLLLAQREKTIAHPSIIFFWRFKTYR